MRYFINHADFDLNLSEVAGAFVDRYLYRPDPTEWDDPPALILSSYRRDVAPGVRLGAHLFLEGTDLAIRPDGTARGIIERIYFFRSVGDDVTLQLEIQGLRLRASDFMARYELTREDRLGQRADFIEFFKDLASFRVGLETDERISLERDDGVMRLDMRGGDDVVQLSVRQLVGRDLDGGAGKDELILSGDIGRMTIDVGANTLTMSRGRVVQVSGFEALSVLYTDADIRFRGSDGDDTLSGSDGDDTMRGGAGGDRLAAWGGLNAVYGGDGDDTIIDGRSENETLDGGAGTDTFVTSEVNIVNLAGGFGLRADRVTKQFFSGFENVTTGAGNNRIYGDSADNVLDGSYGKDTLFGGGGNDTLLSSESIYGDRDYLSGDDGDDVLYGGGERCSLFGGSGDDSLYGGFGRDSARGGEGDDLILAGEGGDWAWAGAGNDRILGGGGNDDLYGKTGDDRIWGGKGRDNLYGGEGDDRISGGRDFDKIYGGGGNDWLFGQRGKDVIFGGRGNDTLIGGENKADILVGGPGSDVFIFNADAEIDRIRDFRVDQNDRLLLDASLWDRHGELTVQEVLERYAEQFDDLIVIQFDRQTAVYVWGVDDLDQLAQAIAFF